MRRLLHIFVAAIALAAVPASASGQVFTVIRDAPDLPSYTVPNGPGSIKVPFDLSRAPRNPEARSYEQLLGLWQRAGSSYGVPWQVLGAINRIESNFGQNMGPSSAGAVGWMQFMPSTWLRWGMDADGDGLANPWNPEDAVFAAARYLAAAGAHDSIERAIFAYNHAQWYVDDVLQQAELFGDDPLLAGAPGLMFQADDLKERTADARRKVARIAEAIDRTDRSLETVSWSRERLERQAGDPRLSAATFRKLDARLARMEAVRGVGASSAGAARGPARRFGRRARRLEGGPGRAPLSPLPEVAGPGTCRRGRLRLPRRRRPRRRLGRPRPPRLSRGRHRGA